MRISRTAKHQRIAHDPPVTKGSREAAFGSRLAFMQAADMNIQDYPAGLANGNHRQRQQSITEGLLDIEGSSWFEFGALPGLDRPDSSTPRSFSAQSSRSPQLLPNR